MADYVIRVEPGHLNLSPVLFRSAARDYFKCYLDFEKSRGFSSVPFFLCCRAIELSLKALHLEHRSQAQLKGLYSHDLMKSYRDLDPKQQTLSADELDLLDAVNAIYSSKGFEYLNVVDAATAYQRFPDLDDLEHLARKIVAYDA